MAAKVGDRTTPVAERKAALDTLVQLQNKYRHLNGGVDAEPVSYPKDAGKPGVKVPSGEAGRQSILSNEMAAEQQKLDQAKASNDLKGISEANRNIQLLQKEIGSTGGQGSAKVRRYNPSTGRIE
jgi:hypothetical protein